MPLCGSRSKGLTYPEISSETGHALTQELLMAFLREVSQFRAQGKKTAQRLNAPEENMHLRVDRQSRTSDKQCEVR